MGEFCHCNGTNELIDSLSMFKDDLYQVSEFNELSENDFEVVVKLNREHDIFNGHFPQQPILPGVCLLNMVTELLSERIGSSLSLVKAKDIKYLKMVDPNSDLDLKLVFKYQTTDNGIELQAQSILLSDESVNMKMKGLYTK